MCRASSHAGTCTTPCARSYSREGKGLRPALCLATCEAFGGSVEDALHVAAAIELLHAAFLIHDDIEDGSEKRRGRSAMHVEYGVPIALNAGTRSRRSACGRCSTASTGSARA